MGVLVTPIHANADNSAKGATNAATNPGRYRVRVDGPIKSVHAGEVPAREPSTSANPFAKPHTFSSRYSRSQGLITFMKVSYSCFLIAA